MFRLLNSKRKKRELMHKLSGEVALRVGVMEVIETAGEMRTGAQEKLNE